MDGRAFRRGGDLLKRAAGRRIRSFTLIELLVVIAIVAILASLLLPALGKAKEMAKSASCQGNLKQTGLCVSSYVDDNAGWLPSSDSDYNNLWRFQLAQYAGIGTVSSQLDAKLASGIFRCPSWNRQSGVSNCNQSGYAWNYAYLGYIGSSGNVPQKRLVQVKKPSETIFIGDNTDWHNAVNPGAFDFGKLGKPSDLSIYAPNMPIGDRHKGGVNYLWGDAHASWMAQSSAMQGANGQADYFFFIDK